MAKNEEHHAETNGQDDQNSRRSCADLPGTDGPPRPMEPSFLTRKVLWLAVPRTQNPCWVRMPRRLPGGLPPKVRGSRAQAALLELSCRLQSLIRTQQCSCPTPRCSQLPERSTKEVLGEDHAQIHPDSLLSGKETHSERPAAIPPLVSASSRLQKRKISMPLSLPLPH